MTASEPTKEEISFTEGVQYAGLALSVVSMLAYLAIVVTRVFTDDVSVTKVAWQGPMLLVIAIAGALYLVGYGIARPRNRRGPAEDVRDREINRYGEAVGAELVTFAVFVSIILLALDVDSFWVAHNLFFGSWFGSFVGSASKAAAYREGIPA